MGEVERSAAQDQDTQMIVLTEYGTHKNVRAYGGEFYIGSGVLHLNTQATIDAFRAMCESLGWKVVDHVG